MDQGPALALTSDSAAAGTVLPLLFSPEAADLARSHNLGYSEASFLLAPLRGNQFWFLIEWKNFPALGMQQCLAAFPWQHLPDLQIRRVSHCTIGLFKL